MAKITNLPPEILAKIFTENGLESSDLAQIARVCKAFSAEATRANYIHNIEQERSSVVILAAQQGRIDWMQKAISMDADTNTVGPGYGETLEEWEDIRYPETYPDDGKYGTPLHYAALRGDDGHASTAHLLLNHGASLHLVYVSEEFSFLPDEPCDSLIHHAAARGLVTLVQRAMDMGTSASATTPDGTTALHCTVWSWNSEAVIRCLVSAGADLDAEGWEGMTPFFCACTAGNFSTALNLLRAGSNIHLLRTLRPQAPSTLRTSGPTRSAEQARTETEDAESRLLYETASGGSDPIPHSDRPEPLDDRDKEQVEFLRTLIEDYDIRYDESYPEECFVGWQSLRNHALISAACCNKYVVPGVVRLLLDNGSDPNHLNLQGKGPLQLLLSNITPSGEWALRDNANKYRQIIYMLVEYGARVSHVHWDLLGKMRLWVKDKRVDRDDRVLLKYLLRKCYEELAAEDETSADDSGEVTSEKDQSEEGDDEASEV
ncbi:hypothetical protein VMCG_07257 [Cytospora schulzeri]|uniref:F-box domain-containing protein n=1 Tax=Cytospora schulzeri TaxID=448051 RepID=A0A423WAE4_9PEZI|nr:hypothetical protein VMCG_07257 [Valsa malicola]